ncbi:MAG: hypothetical protein EOO28_02610 [Comamonadaceae bacterium]|nr:MAG: hypothetical protein EOO28_02610 [Comamonadaceae bacterium]
MDVSIDPAHTDPLVLAKLLEHANAAVQMLDRGIAAIAGLVTHAAAEIDDGTIRSHTVEALGRLLAEMGDFSAALLVLIVKCGGHPQSKG